jgi:hypothetical protein
VHASPLRRPTAAAEYRNGVHGVRSLEPNGPFDAECEWSAAAPHAAAEPHAAPEPRWTELASPAHFAQVITAVTR